MNWLLEGDQVRAKPSTHPVLMRVADMAKPAKVLDLPLTPEIVQTAAARGYMTTRPAAATSRPHLLLVLLSGSLPGRCMDRYDAPDGNSAEPLEVEEGPPLGSAVLEACKGALRQSQAPDRR